MDDGTNRINQHLVLRNSEFEVRKAEMDPLSSPRPPDPTFSDSRTSATETKDLPSYKMRLAAAVLALLPISVNSQFSRFIFHGPHPFVELLSFPHSNEATEFSLTRNTNLDKQTPVLYLRRAPRRASLSAPPLFLCKEPVTSPVASAGFLGRPSFSRGSQVRATRHRCGGRPVTRR